MLMMGTAESRSVSLRVQLHGVSNMQNLGFSGIEGGARRVLMMGTAESRSVSLRVQLHGVGIHGVGKMQGLRFGGV